MQGMINFKYPYKTANFNWKYLTECDWNNLKLNGDYHFVE